MNLQATFGFWSLGQRTFIPGGADGLGIVCMCVYLNCCYRLNPQAKQGSLSLDALQSLHPAPRHVLSQLQTIRANLLWFSGGPKRTSVPIHNLRASCQGADHLVFPPCVQVFCLKLHTAVTIRYFSGGKPPKSGFDVETTKGRENR